MTHPPLQPIGFAEVVAHVEALAAAIETGGWHPGLIVGLGRGGLVPAVLLSHRLGVPQVSLDLSAEVEGFGEALTPRLAGRADLLLVDDINDSGRTLARLRALLPEARAAVLIDNVRSVARADFTAWTIDRATTRDWFVFPWEALAPAATIADEAVIHEGRG